jgi:hypothetical protein
VEVRDRVFVGVERVAELVAMAADEVEGTAGVVAGGPVGVAAAAETGA